MEHHCLQWIKAKFAALAHGLLVDERLTEHTRRGILRTVAEKGADALPHRPREAKRESQCCKPTISFGKHQGRKTLGSNVLYQCNRDADSPHLAAAGKYVAAYLPEATLQVAGFAASFAVISLLFAMMFKWLPDTKVEWRDVWLGAVLTAALFEVGKFLIGLYVGKQGLESTFGAAASIIVVLIWVYYSAQLVLMGAEFTCVYAHRYGSRKHAGSADRQSSEAKAVAMRRAHPA
jgi:Virulence factor BrkB